MDKQKTINDFLFNQIVDDNITILEYQKLIKIFDNLTEDNKKQILAKMKSSSGPVLTNIATLTVAAAPGGTAAIVLSRFIRANFDECIKQCGVLNPNSLKRQLCITQCKILTLTKVLKKLEDEKRKCFQINRQHVYKRLKCELKVNKLIKQTKVRLNKYQEKWKTLNKKAQDKNIEVKKYVGKTKSGWNLYRNYK